jgi:short subunit dehydrogenase-like uncharacterized protein
MATEGARDLDVVVLGATGFVGRLVAGYLAVAAPDDLRVGLAGRSADRLAQVRAGLGPAAEAWPLLVADTGDDASLDVLAAATRVVATTVGPYSRYGLPVAQACARAGTDYCDLTGETLFVRRTLDVVDAPAKASGARLVHSCGFDSIPSDLGVLLLAERARADEAGELEDTRLVVRAMKGGFSGGTIDSMRAMVEAFSGDPSLARVAADPYALSPDREGEPDLGPQRDRTGVGRDGELGAWLGPFVMATYNTRVVRLSNALQGWAYGRRFRYEEAMSYGSGLAAPLLATGMTAGLAAGVAGMRFAPTRAVLDRVLPSPGEGPDERARRRGHFRMELRTRTSTGARYRAVVAARGDPGYQATALMMGESALCLALDRDRLPARAGVLTPATAMGDVLVERLRAAGMTLTVERT